MFQWIADYGSRLKKKRPAHPGEHLTRPPIPRLTRRFTPAQTPHLLQAACKPTLLGARSPRKHTPLPQPPHRDVPVGQRIRQRLVVVGQDRSRPKPTRHPDGAVQGKHWHWQASGRQGMRQRPVVEASVVGHQRQGTGELAVQGFPSLCERRRISHIRVADPMAGGVTPPDRHTGVDQRMPVAGRLSILEQGDGDGTDVAGRGVVFGVEGEEGGDRHGRIVAAGVDKECPGLGAGEAKPPGRSLGGCLKSAGRPRHPRHRRRGGRGGDGGA